MRFLMDDEFVAQAPEDIRSHLLSLRTTSYDYLKPLTRLRNQVYITQKTLLR